MKQSLTAVAFLLAVALGGFLWAHRAVSATAEQVEISETVLDGDPAAAEGLLLKSRAGCDRRMFWETDMRFGEQNAVTTSFRFTPDAETQTLRYDPQGLSMYVVTDLYAHYNSGISLEDLQNRDELSEDNSGHLFAPIADAARRTAAGERREFSFRLADYYEVYPFAFSFELDRVWGSTESKNAPLLREFFQIPVPEDAYLAVTIEKNAQGLISKIETSFQWPGGELIYDTGTATEDAIWYAFDNSGLLGGPLDTSRIPGGYGLYRLPYSRNAFGAAEVRGGELRMVYPLDPAETVIELTRDAQGRLLLFTWRDKTFRLSVIDPDTAGLLQTIELTAQEVPDAKWGVAAEDTFLVIYRADELLVLEAGDGGAWRTALHLYETLMPDLPEAYGELGTAFAWDGDRLAVIHGLSYLREVRAQTSPDFTLQIYDSTGSIYFGRYASSLSDQGYWDNGRAVTRPWSNEIPEAFELAWAVVD